MGLTTFPKNLNVARQPETHNHVDVSIDVIKSTIDNDRSLLGNPHYITTVRRKYYCLDVAHLTL